MKKYVGNSLIGIGLLILFIVSYGVMENQQHQKELIESFTSIKTEAATEKAIVGVKATDAQQLKELKQEVVGILKIPSIHLKSPVLEGATPENLNRALGMIAGLDDPEELNGSSAIAGHQAHVFGQFFNRLNELQVGDRFELETRTDTLQFEVFNIQIVKPENVDILERQKGISLLSLVTCYPERSNMFRLVVQAKKVEN
ncbi:class D sortase [Psychrobacillus glaciei]|uniref:Class D sortase n=1 Tax=Psychrobacillus glaciei TaxID=2283160 RepID=A0A5J6SJH3_9BACI|nr:class D sortase [Psychrobacillus glaciei]QFF97789.1 class D sortase [Psychrobacillus glaciei]